MTSFVSQVGSVAALADPIRRDLYAFVSAQAEAVSRDQAAAAVGVPSHKAKFHLDRLSESGLLEVEYRRLSGKAGPGAGRPTKLYRRADREVSVSLPPREYDLAATIMAAAIEASVHDGTPLPDALRTCARAAGRALASGAVAGATGPGDDVPVRRGGPLDQVWAVLADHGYEPRLEDDDRGQQRVVMANCPFHSLSRTHTELVCGLNSDLIDGLTETLGNGVVTARLEPAPGRCCVVLRTQEG
ncbi:MAG TPA: helix-turn-helix domain-containing protein [Actinomycetales bacterium]|nr:helix-turn-helix domain-containing protein [Actinomycetales bacterium]